MGLFSVVIEAAMASRAADHDRALALNPTRPESWNNRGNMRLALTDYTQSLALKPTRTATLNLSLGGGVWGRSRRLSKI